MEIAVADLVQAKWTDQIHQEWIGHLINKRPEVEKSIQRTKSLMDEAVPDALVLNYESLIDGFTLPDSKDRHVLAAAVKCGAQYIVTANLKDFPQEYLSQFNVEALHPDKLIEREFYSNQGEVIACAKRSRARLRNPEIDATGYLHALEKGGLPVTVRLLQDYRELI